MKRVKIIVFGVSSLFFLSLLTMYMAQPTYSYSAAIIVSEADTIRDLNSVQSTTLEAALNTVAKRIVLRFTNSKKVLDLVAAPAELSVALNAVQKRIVLRFSNTKRDIKFVTVPGQLSTELGEVINRVAIRFANDKREVPLVFPIEIIDDNIAPVVSNVQTEVTNNGVIEISWQTDEVARAIFAYGTQAGSYSDELDLGSFEMTQVVEIPGLSPATYHYRISAEDRSNNQSEVTGTFVITAATPVPTSTALPTATTVPPTATPTSPSEPGGSEDLIYLPLMQR